MGFMETRMYRGLGELIEGWSKNIYLGGRRSFPDEPLLRAAAPLMVAAALLFWLVPRQCSSSAELFVPPRFWPSDSRQPSGY